MPAAPQGGRDLAVGRRADARRLTRIGGALSDAHAAYAPDSTAHSAIVPVPHSVSLPCTSLHQLSRQSPLTYPLGDSGNARGGSRARRISGRHAYSPARSGAPAVQQCCACQLLASCSLARRSAAACQPPASRPPASRPPFAGRSPTARQPASVERA